MKMDIQTKKLDFVRDFIRLNDERLVDKFRELLKIEKNKKFEKELSPYSLSEFNQIIDKSESDSENGRLTSARELQKEAEKWN
jgi:hypothetical protein